MNTIPVKRKAVLTRSLKAVGTLVIMAALAGFWLGATHGIAQADSPVWRDEFDGPLLEGWSWMNEEPSMWNLTEQPGFLRIYTSSVATWGQNLLLRPAPEGDFAIQTRLLFEPGVDFQIAGLVIYQDQGNFLQFGRAFCDVPESCVGNGLYFDHVQGGVGIDGNFATSTGSSSEAFLRLQRMGQEVQAFFSEDGMHWSMIGTHTLAGDFAIAGIGLGSSQNIGEGVPPVAADFDYFALGLPVYSFPRIIASESGDWFWTTDFAGEADLSFSIYESQDADAILLWSGSQTADASGFVNVAPGFDLLPGNYLVVSDGISTKGVVLEPISMDVFDVQKDIMAGTAPAGREVRAAAGPQDWQAEIWVTADPDGTWVADFNTIHFNITEAMRTWSYAQIFDDDWDANEAGTPPPPPPPQAGSWVAAYTYDLPAGAWSEGTHSYHYEWVDTFGGGEITDLHIFDVSPEAPLYMRYVQLRANRALARIPGDGTPQCVDIDVINPAQPTRFHFGIVVENMTYGEARAYFESLQANAYWDADGSAQLIRQEIRPWDEAKWEHYLCTWTLRE